MIRELLEGRTAEQRASIKGLEITRVLVSNPRTNVKFSGADFDIEILETKPINKGVEIFAGAWKDSKQIGFGADGSVDIERFRFINPTIEVLDPNGDILHEWVDPQGVPRSRKLREDPQQALLNDLAHTILVSPHTVASKNIVQGKRGSTVSTYHPAAGNTSPMDTAVAQVYSNGAGQSWATIIAAAGGGHSLVTTSNPDSCVPLRADSPTADTWRRLHRVVILFDASDIAHTDDISAVTFSVVRSNDGASTLGSNPNIGVFTSSPAANDSTVDGDYATFGSVKQSDTVIALADFQTDGTTYDNFVFNATGRGNISKTGVSKFGMRADSYDVAAVSPTWVDNTSDDLRLFM